MVAQTVRLNTFLHQPKRIRGIAVPVPLDQIIAEDAKRDDRSYAGQVIHCLRVYQKIQGVHTGILVMLSRGIRAVLVEEQWAIHAQPVVDPLEFNMRKQQAWNLYEQDPEFRRRIERQLNMILDAMEGAAIVSEGGHAIA